MFTWKRLAASTMLLAAFGVVAVGSKKKDDVTVTKGDKDDDDDKDSKKKDKETPPAKIGDKVDFEDSSWVVTEAKDLGKELKANNTFIKPKKTEGRFVMVRFKVTNKGKKEAHLLNPKVVDSKDREFGNFDEQYSYLPDDAKGVALEGLQPDVTKSFGSIYELPEGATGLKFQATELELFGGKKALIDLGL